MRDNVNNRMLALPLDDCHIPAFCSFSKPYFGYAENMEDFFEALKTEKNTEYLLKTYESFKAGNSIQYNVAYHEEKFLEPVSVVCKRQEHLGRKQWEFINTWGFPYKVRFSSGDLDIALVKYEKKYIRVFKAVLFGLSYKDEVSVEPKWRRLNGSFWGFPQILTFDETDLRKNKSFARLYLPEKSYEKREEALKDFASPVSLDAVGEEIFADG